MAVLRTMPLVARNDSKLISAALGKAGLKKINYNTIYSARNAIKAEHANSAAQIVPPADNKPGIFDILIFHKQVNAIGIENAKDIIAGIEKISK